MGMTFLALRHGNCTLALAERKRGRYLGVMLDNEFDEFLKNRGLSDNQPPTIEEIDRAIEQPGEADPATVAYIRARPELAKIILRLKRTIDRLE